MDAATAYFLKKYYPRVIKWWVVTYNPEVVRIWPSKKEEDEALRLEALEAKKTKQPALPDDSAYNAATNSYSGLYGQQPIDEQVQASLAAILNTSSRQSYIDSYISGGKPGDDVITPPEQAEIINEANAIYDRLLREAAEDEAARQAEIEESLRQAELKFAQQSTE